MVLKAAKAMDVLGNKEARINELSGPAENRLRQPSRNMRQPVVLARPTIKLCIPWSNWNARGGGA
jgi:hypothetical protein